jgi:hypothetical protein
MMRIILYCLISVTVVTQARAQNACEVTLNNAQEEFNAGRFDAVPALLKECLEKNQNREWEQRAYLLLAETYLLLENPAKADESYLKVLQANPEYVTDAARDPIDLVYLSKKFTATPIFSFHGKIGLNTSFIRVIHDVKISNAYEENYTLKAGWQAGLGVDYHYNSAWSLSMEANYSYTAFSHNAKNLFEDYTMVTTDRQTWLNIPVMIKFSAQERALRPFGFVGYSTDLLLRDRAIMVIDGDIESEVFDYKYKRNTFNRSILLGAGLKYKWGLRYIYGELRYSMGLSNLTSAAQRFDHFDGINNSWPYADDDFKMDNVLVSIGYIHPFYKARQLKKPRTRSVLRKSKKNTDAPE